jgi:hypothetical protein
VYAPRVGRRPDRTTLATDLLTRSLGAADGYDAVAQCRWERMPAGAACYLDTTALWGGDSPNGRPAGLLDYYKGWIGAVLDSGTVHPGTCCTLSDASALAESLSTVYRERHRTAKRPSFWIVSANSAMDRDVSTPAAMLGAPARSGADATWQTEVWQPTASVTRQSYGGASLAVSTCWATTADPSFDPSIRDPALDPAALTATLRSGVAATVTAGLPSPLVADARALMEACLAALGLAKLGGAHPFPHGIGDVEIQLTERDGAVDARIRVSGNEQDSP